MTTCYDPEALYEREEQATEQLWRRCSDPHHGWQCCAAEDGTRCVPCPTCGACSETRNLVPVAEGALLIEDGEQAAAERMLDAYRGGVDPRKTQGMRQLLRAAVGGQP